jgi:hypothetical protein
VGKPEEGLVDVLHLRDDEAVVDKPKVVFAAYVWHAQSGAGKFHREWVRFCNLLGCR